jgi:hypothetical protein
VASVCAFYTASLAVIPRLASSFNTVGSKHLLVAWAAGMCALKDSLIAGLNAGFLPADIPDSVHHAKKGSSCCSHGAVWRPHNCQMMFAYGILTHAGLGRLVAASGCDFNVGHV